MTSFLVSVQPTWHLDRAGPKIVADTRYPSLWKSPISVFYIARPSTFKPKYTDEVMVAQTKEWSRALLTKGMSWW